MLSAFVVRACVAGMVLMTTGRIVARAEEAPMVATDWHVAHASRVRLVGGGHFDANDPKSPLLAGVEIRLDPNWKTYWRMPGEAGVPPQFDWSKSENVAKVDVLYPAPRRYPDKAGDAVGYSAAVIFPVVVTPRDASKPVKLSVELSFGICKDICVPLETTLGVPLDKPIAGARPPKALNDMLDRVPRREPDLRREDPRIASIKGAIGAEPKTLTITATPPGGGHIEDVFLEAPDGLFVPMSKRAATASSGIQSFTVDFARLPDAADLVGKPLRITVVGASGASETVFIPSR